MLTLLTTRPTTNDKNGDGKYKPLRKRKKTKKAENSENFKYLDNNDLTMKFSNARDPIYFVFDCLEKRSVPELISDFVQDYFSGVVKFVAKAVS